MFIDRPTDIAFLSTWITGDITSEYRPVILGYSEACALHGSIQRLNKRASAPFSQDVLKWPGIDAA